MFCFNISNLVCQNYHKTESNIILEGGARAMRGCVVTCICTNTQKGYFKSQLIGVTLRIYPLLDQRVVTLCYNMLQHREKSVTSTTFFRLFTVTYHFISTIGD